jgi:alanine racemase
VAFLEEALQLRASGIDEPILSWLWTPQDEDLLARALTAGVDVSVSSVRALESVAARTAGAGAPARIHLKIDTGLARNGATSADWPDLVRAAARAAASGAIEVIGIWSHLASAEVPDAPTTGRQISAFGDALATAAAIGVVPAVRHLANSAGLLVARGADFDLVRTGVAIYGLSPAPAVGTFDLVPAMTLRTHLANVKRVPAGQGVAYNHRYVTDRPTTLALVPLGYADGVPRSATNTGPVAIDGARFRISGTVAMDQFVVDVGDAAVREGDEVILFGPGRSGEPTAQDWAEAMGTINYEVVTRIGARVPRTYRGLPA